MKLNFCLKNNDDIKVLYDIKDIDKLKSHHNMVILTLNIMKSIFNISYFVLKNINTYLIENGTVITLKVQNELKELYDVTILNNIITIQNNSCYYKFVNDYDGTYYYISLLEYINKCSDKTVKQSFYKSSNFNVEIILNDKIYKLIMPYSTDYTIDPNIFEFIHNNTSIEEFKKFYLRVFYNNQTDYEKHLNTVLSIEEIYADNPILLDELIICYGNIRHYMISTRCDDFLMSASGSNPFDTAITIQNYITNQSVNLNNLAQDLLKRTKKLSSHIG